MIFHWPQYVLISWYMISILVHSCDIDFSYAKFDFNFEEFIKSNLVVIVIGFILYFGGFFQGASPLNGG